MKEEVLYAMLSFPCPPAAAISLAEIPKIESSQVSKRRSRGVEKIFLSKSYVVLPRGTLSETSVLGEILELLFKRILNACQAKAQVD